MDCDPERPAGILHPEGTRAITTACGAWDDLRSSGFGDPVVADSGNGGHPLYRQDLPNDQLANALIQRVLIGVATRCAPYDVDIDLAVYNAARICKLYGTMARKAIRPSIVPTGIRAFLRSPAPRNPPVGGLVNPLDRVASWADDQPAAPIVEPSAAPPISQDFSVQAFIERHGLKVRRRGEWKGGEKWELEFCPINPEHTGGCVIITRGSNGSLGFKCQHNSCAGIGWTKLRERLEPGYRKSDCVAGWGERSGSDGWPPIVPFSVISVERIPEHLLPGPVGDMARSVAAATETPLEMAVMTGLGILAASVAGKVQICPTPGYSEPLQIFTATVLP